MATYLLQLPSKLVPGTSIVQRRLQIVHGKTNKMVDPCSTALTRDVRF